MSNIFAKIWKDYDEKNISYPTRVRKIISLEFKEFKKKLMIKMKILLMIFVTH